MSIKYKKSGLRESIFTRPGSTRNKRLCAGRMCHEAVLHGTQRFPTAYLNSIHRIQLAMSISDEHLTDESAKTE